MIAHQDIKQTSIEWFEIKWGKIGGTLAKGLHTKGDTLFIDLLSQHLEEFEPSEGFSNEHTERGNDLEPFAREYLQKYTGYTFRDFGWLQSEENELLGISPDGLTECLTIAMESKCLSRKKHTEILLTNEIPLEYIHQCIHYFTVNASLEKLYFCAFRPESVKSFVKELTLDSIVNIGTKARPQAMTIEAVVDYSIEFANELLIRINNNKDKLSF
jgi:hypothetical protein